MTYLFDGRWRGNFGIGRYADELETRLAPAKVVRSTRVAPLSPADPAYLLYRTVRSRADLFFTPGFNASAPGPFRQLLIMHDLIYVRTQPPGSLKRRYLELVVRPAIRRTGTVLTDSEFSRGDVAEWTGLDPSAVVVCGGGLNAAFHGAAVPTVGAPLRSVLFVGNDKPHKNLATLLAAIALLADVTLVCVGVDPQQTRPLAVAAGVGDRVSFHQGLSDPEIVELYRACDVLAFPSSYEGFGLPALEAMSQGKPVVFGSDAVAEIVADTGRRTSDPHDAEELADLLARAVATDSPAAATARIARAATYTWEAVAERVSGLVTELQ